MMQKFSLEPIYSRLGDDESRFLFEKRLCYSLTGDMQGMVRAMNNENSVYKKLKETEKTLFLFGAGARSHRTINVTPEIPWQAFIDNDKSKLGKSDTLPIISFEEFIKNSENAMVFISSYAYGFEMKQQLISNDFPENYIVSYPNQYFDLPYLKPQKNEFFIDAGGYDGFSTRDFFSWGEGRSIIFEPNLIQCNICKNNMQSCDKVQVVNKGLWYKKETLNFYKNQKLPSSSHINPDGEEIIEAISLDEYLKDEKEPVTFIKMDVE
ncbi:MAG: FkbM family methyltransferase, partial [Fibromonadales bacterium]|nr:FkbM family methyltransferase [Fibromonadales bacterium]